MSSARRPLLTAAAAGTLLCALWFVPTANATQETADTTGSATSASTQVSTQARATTADAVGTAGRTATAARTAADTTTETTTDTAAGTTDADGLSGAGTRLADTGSFDTTPYVVGGTTLLALGAGFVVYSVRRERLGL
ncbi:LPXTG cell wall anchor domain-containing protein [Streptomyces longwoodensis]|uniref:LPXTG cell wall anchor domain-containing protein n=1 Tax=Streptomyces lasalocidi TaxID=324833 RepID=A0A4U5WP76_STRLS|nr:MULTISPECIES: LPXTG cell wall anchor domain-containing protein [Streptomyces]TKT02466.1 LPXTG cell wall anchor domain-containing protein [Streptomyces lasalocidi]WRY90337.1 LPXTG cell wall anchor domain-containing protein [Streptomyces longwoodensis]WUC71648.1 LPXTG cell wall anchor domain-containing protein [Streptomyces longwoodensis]